MNQEITPLSSEKSSTTEPMAAPPVYHKPKTSLFLEKASDIKSGSDDILESSNGTGFLSS